MISKTQKIRGRWLYNHDTLESFLEQLETVDDIESLKTLLADLAFKVYAIEVD